MKWWLVYSDDCLLWSVLLFLFPFIFCMSNFFCVLLLWMNISVCQDIWVVICRLASATPIIIPWPLHKFIVLGRSLYNWERKYIDHIYLQLFNRLETFTNRPCHTRRSEPTLPATVLFHFSVQYESKRKLF